MCAKINYTFPANFAVKELVKNQHGLHLIWEDRPDWVTFDDVDRFNPIYKNLAENLIAFLPAIANKLGNVAADWYACWACDVIATHGKYTSMHIGKY